MRACTPRRRRLRRLFSRDWPYFRGLDPITHAISVWAVESIAVAVGTPVRQPIVTNSVNRMKLKLEGGFLRCSIWIISLVCSPFLYLRMRVRHAAVAQGTTIDIDTSRSSEGTREGFGRGRPSGEPCNLEIDRARKQFHGETEQNFAHHILDCRSSLPQY